ncbi:dynamin [Anaeramoeba flamelloides]|uniref:dynamin GTPase n=1 Tax=Anaeramoeba flamelloides TaxID=1746091 RepID=A0AAV8AEI8_9EUKA|nr:dynamin [Anaeramoeba flamelloides]
MSEQITKKKRRKKKTKTSTTNKKQTEEKKRVKKKKPTTKKQTEDQNDELAKPKTKKKTKTSTSTKTKKKISTSTKPKTQSKPSTSTKTKKKISTGTSTKPKKKKKPSTGTKPKTKRKIKIKTKAKTTTKTKQKKKQKKLKKPKDQPEGTKLITMVNKLQDAFTRVGMVNLDMPQIAVVGCQSSGKSSVLESVVGRDFLPRGSGIVTRRPLVLQLIRDSSLSSEYGQFLHKGERKYFDFKEIEDEIVRDTDRITGKNKGLSPIPINLKLFSPSVVNLTMIDLPGVTKIAVGDQPENIEEQINDMVLNYISRPNCIILAVTPANTDLANSDSLKLAKQVDPKRSRTVGVLTKLDLMDEGTDAVDILEGRILDLKFIGVVNRSQKDLLNNKDVRSALNAEQQFFQSHPKYMHMAHVMGSKYLAKVLNSKLISHIKSSLPAMADSTAKELKSSRKKLKKLGGGDNLKKKEIAFKALSGFTEEFKNMIDGNSKDANSREGKTTEENLFGGAKIRHQFTTSLKRDIEELKIEEELTDKKIKIYMQNAEGAISRLGIPEKVFHWSIKVGIVKFLEPCLKCVRSVEKELIQIIVDTADQIDEFTPFPVLKERILEIANMLVGKYREPTLELVSEIVKMELSYINFEHPGLKLNKYIEDRKGKVVQGWMITQSVKSKKWGQMWFVLKERTLFYYENPDSKSPVAEIPLEGCIVETLDDINKARSKNNPKTTTQQPKTFENVGTEEKAPQSTQKQPKKSIKTSMMQKETQRKNKERGIKIIESKALKTLASGKKVKKGLELDEKCYVRIRHPSGRRIVGKTRIVEIFALDHFSFKNWIGNLKKSAEGFRTGVGKRTYRDIWAIREIVVNYFDAVKTNLYDSIPKAIMFSMVNEAKKELESVLMARVYDEDMLADLMEEDSNVVKQRKDYKKKIALLEEVQDIMSDVKSIKNIKF